MESTCCTVRGDVTEYGFPGHVGFGSRYPSPTDVTLSKPFVHSVPSPWKVKMALSNSYSQQMNSLVNLLTPVLDVTACDEPWPSTSDVISFDQMCRHVYSTAAGGKGLSNNTQI